ncbi:hypothetical protein HK098_007540 [Nowakowskiella sp. JEL0407]|nr:hypothetical protein HK098_007540 [Nowakowskiella sp. JEL0407]
MRFNSLIVLFSIAFTTLTFAGHAENPQDYRDLSSIIATKLTYIQNVDPYVKYWSGVFSEYTKLPDLDTDSIEFMLNEIRTHIPVNDPQYDHLKVVVGTIVNDQGTLDPNKVGKPVENLITSFSNDATSSILAASASAAGISVSASPAAASVSASAQASVSTTDSVSPTASISATATASTSSTATTVGSISTTSGSSTTSVSATTTPTASPLQNSGNSGVLGASPTPLLFAPPFQPGYKPAESSGSVLSVKFTLILIAGIELLLQLF